MRLRKISQKLVRHMTNTPSTELNVLYTKCSRSKQGKLSDCVRGVKHVSMATSLRAPHEHVLGMW